MMRQMMRRNLCIAMAMLLLSTSALARFDFVALGDTAYNGTADYPVYDQLIEAINDARPEFSIHVGDIWGAGNCHSWHVDKVGEFFDQFKKPLIYTPGDNEWTDCNHRAMGGYDPAERLQELRKNFFGSADSLGKKSMELVRQADVSEFKKYVENSRWVEEKVLFFTLNVPGSNNNFDYQQLESLAEAHERTEANVAWLRDSFRVAREQNYAAVVIALHAELFLNGQMGLADFGGPMQGPYGPIIRELRLATERFGKPILLIHGDSHEFVVDRPLLESQGESKPPKYANLTRLEVFGAPEIKAVRVTVDTKTPWVFSFSPLYTDSTDQ